MTAKIIVAMLVGVSVFVLVRHNSVRFPKYQVLSTTLEAGRRRQIAGSGVRVRHTVEFDGMYNVWDTFDREGHLINERWTFRDIEWNSIKPSFGSEQYTYSGDRLVAWFRKGSFDPETLWNSIEYDSMGRVRKETGWTTKNGLFTHKEYEYYQNGYLKEERDYLNEVAHGLKIFSYKDSVSEHYSLQFDFPEVRTVKEYSCTWNGSRYVEILNGNTWTYDRNGLAFEQVGRQLIVIPPYVEWKGFNHYKMDKRGNPIEMTVVDSLGERRGGTKYEYQYYENAGQENASDSIAVPI